jgi:hypothetical protein
MQLRVQLWDISSATLGYRVWVMRKEMRKDLGRSLATMAGLVGAAALMLAATSANASTYDFSYSFGPYGGLVTGSFTGTGPITDVTDISNISVSYNGVPLTGPLYAFSYIGSSSGGCYAPANCFSASGVVVSSIATDNNFVFINSSSVNDMSSFSPPFTNYFYMIPWGNGAGNPEAVQYYNSSTYVPSNQYNGDLIPTNWQLTETPLPSTWTMLIASLLGVAVFAYRGSKKGLSGAAAA